jgi:predicted DNA-binding transcriptional regulator AlpA
VQHYDFTLRFALGRSDADPESCLERLASEGCDDALIGLGSRGRIALNFTRKARSASEAVTSAVSDVKRAIPDAKLIEVGPDLVGLTDIAELLGFSRQNMRKLMLKGDADFPLPVHDGKPAIWHLAKVLAWLEEKKPYPIDETLLDVARISMQCNLLREIGDIDPDISKRLRAMMA